MLNKDSFLRQVPHALGMKDRLVFEGAGWAIQAISHAYDELVSAAMTFDVNDPDAAAESVMFMNCWSIVDQCHMLGSLLKRLKPKAGGEIQKFILKTEKYTLIRNSMDHLAGMIDNIVKSKTVRPPLFGALSFCRFSETDFVDGVAVQCSVISVTAGSVMPVQGWRIMNPADHELTTPVGVFEFEAFDHVVSIAGLMKDILALVQHFDTVTGPEVDRRIEAAAVAGGFDLEKHLKPRGGGGLRMELKIKFEDVIPGTEGNESDV